MSAKSKDLDRKNLWKAGIGISWKGSRFLRTQSFCPKRVLKGIRLCCLCSRKGGVFVEMWF